MAAGHALIYKRDPRAALGWIATCVFFPLVGPLLYFAFGINRARTRARRMISPLRGRRVSRELEARAPHDGALAQLDRVGAALTGTPLVAGNRVELLHNGEAAFPAMLAAIDSAREEILLSTYIFETNATGRRFVDALAAAVERGVRVRAMIDGVGALYSFPRAARLLRRRNVPVALFFPPRLFPPSLRINLRTHRKVLIVDGRQGFTGAKNLGDRHLAERVENKRRVVDMHALVEGPVVHELRRVFVEDWEWVTSETLGPLELPVAGDAGATSGGALCRVVADGPSEDLGRLEILLVAAVSLAVRHVRIMTPYFLPPRSLVGALQAAALRGIDVTVVLPASNNLVYMTWATQKMLWEVLSRGVRVLRQPGPFVHTKLFAIDDDYVLVGSANLDPRSLRLNFELALECYDRTLAATVVAHFEAAVARATEVTLAEMDSRPLLVKIRDGLAWLASPYL